MLFNDSDQGGPRQLAVDFAKYGFKTSSVRCRDYGRGGLPYPDSMKPQEAQEGVVERDKAIPLEVGPRSYRLVRFYE